MQGLGQSKPWEDEGGSELGEAAKEELGCPIRLSPPHPRAKRCPGWIMSAPGLSWEERRAGRDKCEVLGSAQRKPELGNLGEGWGRG